MAATGECVSSFSVASNVGDEVPVAADAGPSVVYKVGIWCISNYTRSEYFTAVIAGALSNAVEGTGDRDVLASAAVHSSPSRVFGAPVQNCLFSSTTLLRGEMAVASAY